MRTCEFFVADQFAGGLRVAASVGGLMSAADLASLIACRAEVPESHERADGDVERTVRFAGSIRLAAMTISAVAGETGNHSSGGARLKRLISESAR